MQRLIRFSSQLCGLSIQVLCCLFSMSAWCLSQPVWNTRLYSMIEVTQDTRLHGKPLHSFVISAGHHFNAQAHPTIFYSPLACMLRDLASESYTSMSVCVHVDGYTYSHVSFTSPQSTLAMSWSTSSTTPDRPTPALQWTSIGMEGSYRLRNDLTSTKKSAGKRNSLSH